MSLYIDEATKQRLAPRPVDPPQPQPVPQGFSQSSYDEGYAPATGNVSSLAGDNGRTPWQNIGDFGGSLVGWGQLDPSLQPDSGASYAQQREPANRMFLDAAMQAGIPTGLQVPAPDFGAIGSAVGDATYRGFGALDSGIHPAQFPAPEYGRTPTSDSLFTAGPQGEVVGPTGNVAELRLGREPVMGEDVNAGLRRTAYGRAQQEQLAAEEQAAFRDAGERAISGAVPDGGTPPLGGGSGVSDAEFARLTAAADAEKAATGAVSAETHDALMNLLGERIGATPTAEQAAAREAFYRDPANLGGGVGLSAEQQANVSGTVQRAGQLNTIRDSLASAREQPLSRAEQMAQAREEFARGQGASQTFDQTELRQIEGRMLEEARRNVAERLTRNRNELVQGLDITARINKFGPTSVEGRAAQDEARRLFNLLPSDDPLNEIPVFVSNAQSSATDSEAILRALDQRIQSTSPSALDSVIARTADTQPPPGYLDRFRQPPAGGADLPGSQPPIVPKGGFPRSNVTPEEAFKGNGDYEPFPPLPSAVSGSVGVSETMKPTLLEQAADVANAPRTLLTSFDLSAPFRQGAMLIGHPREFFGAMKPMVQSFASSDVAHAVDQAIHASPYATVKDQAGLYLAPLDYTGPLALREEAFMSRTVGRLPGVEGSQRAYTTFLNKVRSDTFDHFWSNLPTEAQTPATAARYARFINAATGRGTLPNALADFAPALNAAFFSPRYFISRFESNGMGALALGDLAKSAVTMQALDPVSKAIAGDVLKFYATGLTALGLAKMAGASVEADPRSSDFGKIRVGDTRYDVWAGNQQIARFIAQESSGERKNLSSGNIQPAARNTTVLNFLRSKLAPVPGLMWDTLKGTTPTGEKMDATPATLKRQLWNSFVPLVAQDIVDGVQNDGAVGGIKALPTILGVGTQTFAPTTPKSTAKGGLPKIVPPKTTLPKLAFPKIAKP